MGQSTMNYVTGGLKTVGGAVATAFGAPEIGIPMMTSGAGQLAGQGAGGNSGSSMGSGIGGMLGGLGGGMGGMDGSAITGVSTGSGFAAPGQSGTPSVAQMGSNIPSWINPQQSPGVQASQQQPGMLQQALSTMNQMAPAAQALMGQMKPPQQPAQPPSPPQPQPQQRSPQQPPAGVMPGQNPAPPVPTAGAPKPPGPSMQQIAAIMGMPPFNG